MNWGGEREFQYKNVVFTLNCFHCATDFVSWQYNISPLTNELFDDVVHPTRTVMYSYKIMRRARHIYFDRAVYLKFGSRDLSK